MPEDRLDQVYDMVSNLITMVEHTNPVVEELRVDVKELRGGKEEIKKSVVRLEEKMDRHLDYQASIFEMLGEHEAEIRTWRREKRKNRPTELP